MSKDLLDATPRPKPKPTYNGATARTAAADISLAQELFPDGEPPDAPPDHGQGQQDAQVNEPAAPMDPPPHVDSPPATSNLPEAHPQCEAVASKSPQPPLPLPRPDHPDSPPQEPQDNPQQARPHVGDRYGNLDSAGGAYPFAQDGYGYMGYYPPPPSAYGYYERPQHPPNPLNSMPQWYRQDTPLLRDHHGMIPPGDYRGYDDRRPPFPPDYRASNHGSSAALAPVDHGSSSGDLHIPPPREY